MDAIALQEAQPQHMIDRRAVMRPVTDAELLSRQTLENVYVALKADKVANLC
jgi:hypothetical protein